MNVTSKKKTKDDSNVIVRPHNGIPYIEFMKHVHTVLKPESYFEIGTSQGYSLNWVEADAVAVDPSFGISSNVVSTRARTFMFQMPSDKFFKKNNLFDYFPSGVDIAFLDGMHLFEFLLRDFINTERYCNRNSIIFLHDCMPTNYEQAEREFSIKDRKDKAHAKWWAGDVWKILPALKKHRPDLKIIPLDCPPTGLVAITNLDPNSLILDREYHGILDEFMNNDLTNADLAPLHDSLNITSSQNLMRSTELYKHFSL